MTMKRASAIRSKEDSDRVSLEAAYAVTGALAGLSLADYLR